KMLLLYERLQNLLLNAGQIRVGSVDILNLLLQPFYQLLLFDAVADDEMQIVVIPRFFDILIQTDFVDRLDGILFVGVPRQDDPRRCVNATSR
ncbi:MAG: hypothetical protein QGI32_21305, partial [Candidatus Latescibacteria bacterium]|nr:hypothetical protein [Candidatus Latescibacterota bacterium]